MALNAGTAYVDILPEMKRFGADLKSGVSNAAGDAGEQASSKIGGGFKKAVAMAGAAFAGLQVVDFFKGAIGAASDFNETLSKARSIFGEGAGAIETWAKGAASNIGLSETAALDAAGTFGNMFTQLGIGAEQAASMSVGITGLAADFASFHNADISEVISAQSAAFRGEYDALQRFLPLINAAAVEQRALEMTGKATTKELTAQEKALAVNALMHEGAGKAAGDFARTSDGLANKQRILSAQFENVKTRIGSALLPVMLGFVSFLSGALSPAMDAIGATVRFFAGVWDTVGTALTAVGVVITAVILPHFVALGVQATISAAKSVAGWVAHQAAAIAAAATHTFQIGVMVAGWVLMGVQSLINAGKVAAAWLISIGPIAIVIATVIGAVALIIKHWDTIRAAIATAFNWVRDNWPLLLAILTGPIGLAVLAITKHWDTIKAGVTAVKDWIVGRFNDIVGFITGLPGRISAAASGMWDGIKNAFKAAVNWVLGKWNDLKFEIGGQEVFGVNLPGVTINTPDIPLLAAGGVVARVGAAIVGDRGPELLQLPRGARVTPLQAPDRQLEPAAGGGGGGAGGPLIGEVNINGANLSASDVADEIAWQLRTSGR